MAARDAASEEAERTKIIQRHLDALSGNKDLIRDKKIGIDSHEPNRIKDAYKVCLPFAHSHIPVVVVYPTLLRFAPELYIRHEGWEGFAPMLKSLASYNVDDPETTVKIFLELRRLATCFQLANVRASAADLLLDANAALAAFDMQRDITPDQFQLFYSASEGEISWAVQFTSYIPGKDVEGRCLLKGRFRLGNDASIDSAKCSLELFSEIEALLRRHSVRMRLPKPNDPRLDRYVEDVAAKLQETILHLTCGS